MELWTFLNPILKIFFYVSVVGTAGTALFIFHFRKLMEKENILFCNKVMLTSSGLGIFVCIFYFFSIAGNFGGDIMSAFNFELLKLASNTTVGQVAILTIIAHTLVCCTIFTVNKVGRIILIICTIGIVISFAMVGHSSTNGYLAQLLLLIHLTCISYWLGSFIPLRQLCKYSNYKVVSDVAHKFGVYAVSYVGLLVLSGIFYSYILLGDIRNIFSTSYGVILLIKFISVNLLLLIGALNKFRYVPMIETHPEKGVGKLYSSINYEIMLTIFVLILTSLLTTSFMLPMYNSTMYN
jgi:putative copper resistance protein D